jgi:hypothetical protein
MDFLHDILRLWLGWRTRHSLLNDGDGNVTGLADWHQSNQQALRLPHHAPPLKAQRWLETDAKIAAWRGLSALVFSLLKLPASGMQRRKFNSIQTNCQWMCFNLYTQKYRIQ